MALGDLPGQCACWLMQQKASLGLIRKKRRSTGKESRRQRRGGQGEDGGEWKARSYVCGTIEGWLRPSEVERHCHVQWSIPRLAPMLALQYDYLLNKSLWPSLRSQGSGCKEGRKRREFVRTLICINGLDPFNCETELTPMTRSPSRA